MTSLKTALSTIGEIETWMPIPGYEGSYEASDRGRIRSLKRPHPRLKNRTILGGILSNRRTPAGYETVALADFFGKLVKQVHRLVAMAFIPNPESKKTVNHKNGVKHDNRMENLEWASYSENNIHAVMTGLIKPRRKYSEVVVLAVRVMIQSGVRNKDIAFALGAKKSFVNNIKQGACWRSVQLTATESKGEQP